MRVVVIHNRYRTSSPSGENQVVDREVELLGTAGHEVIQHERCSDEIANFPPVARALLPARITWSEAERRRLTGLLDASEPDVVHVHNTFPLLSASVLAACRRKGVPVVVTLHNFRLSCANGMLVRNGRRCHSCVGRLPLPAVRHGCYRSSPLRTLPVATMIATHRTLRTWQRLVDRFVVPSASTRDILVAGGLPGERVVVKPHFVDDPELVRSGAGKDLLYLGRLSAEKGLATLMDAWARRRRPGRLVIVGDGPMREQVQAWADRTPDASYLGPQPRRRCAQLLAEARCVLAPSIVEETFGLVVIEAFASGVGVIGSAVGSFPELIEDGRSGWLVPPGRVAALADRIDRVLAEPAVAQAVGAHARSRYEERYSPAVNLALLERLYGQLGAVRT